ncbi:MAG: hypothetical protein ABI663_02885 [Chryseolinea sp.]
MKYLNHNSNTLKFLSSLFLCLIVCSLANAQQDSNENKSVVLYDPLLWKHELKLNAGQREKIEKINLEFYQSIYKTANERTSDRAALQSKANQYLQQRSQEIWDAFNPNQRRKWKRLWDHYSS